MGKVVGAILNDWRLAGVLTAGSGETYDLGFSYQNNGGTQNLTGSPDFNARIYYIGDPGSGCSSDQYRQFNVTAVSGPTYNSTMMESGRNRMRGCADNRVDMSLSRDIRMGGNRTFEFRLDVFNLFDTVIYDQRNQSITLREPDRPHRPQLADARGWLERSGAAGAAERGLRCGNRARCRSAACSSSSGSRSNQSGGLRPPDPPTPFLAGALGPAPERWLVRCAHSRRKFEPRGWSTTSSEVFSFHSDSPRWRLCVQKRSPSGQMGRACASEARLCMQFALGFALRGPSPVTFRKPLSRRIGDRPAGRRRATRP